MPDSIRLGDRLQELAELGPSGFAFRVGWELKLRSGLARALERTPAPLPPAARPAAGALAGALGLDPPGVAGVMRERLTAGERRRLEAMAAGAAEGRLLAFGRWEADHGQPPDWYLNPVNGRRWSPALHWSRALREERRVGDVKLTWEAARFPQAYTLARAGVHDPGKAPGHAAALAAQVTSFCAATPFGRGIHWNSGQEIVFRLMAWLFGLGALRGAPAMEAAAPLVAEALHQGAVHVERHLGYTLHAVYNNHLLSEALGLLLAGTLLPAAPRAARWQARGLAVLEGQAARQFYPDGGYIQLSHNYERVALQVYLWAVALRRAEGQPVPQPWLDALGRAVDFLHAHQNPEDGRLPNYGSNDGALPSPLTACAYADFRPTLQAASLAARGERLYEPGPWDEEAAWLVGPAALEAPLRPRARRSVSFAPTGFHVLRGRDPSTFGAFRCGTIRDRFSQIDMLHLDVWWRGQNVLADGGSYLYNGPARWHEHFLRTASHNTVAVDGRDQMLHFRRFKTLYWTEAALTRFEDGPGHALAAGHHLGYRRHPGGCVHARQVLLVKDDLWVVVDTVSGEGEHEARLHWLAGDFPHAFEAGAARLTLDTPRGPFCVAVLDEAGRPLVADVVAGGEVPPRGWLSRHYGERRPVASLAASRRGPAPLRFVSLLSAGPAAVKVEAHRWTVSAAGREIAFRLGDGGLAGLEAGPVEPPRT